MFSQICIFASAAVLSVICYLLEYRLLRWRRAGKEVKGDRIWKNLRRFSGWMCAGCAAGAVAFSAWMQWRSNAYRFSVVFQVPDKRQDFYELRSSSGRYYVVFHIFYPVAQLCIVFAMNMLLRRVSGHASHSYYNVARDQDAGRSTQDGKFDWRDCVGEYALYKLVRAIHIIAMLLCALHVAARVVAAGFTAEEAARYNQAAAATDPEGRDTQASSQINSQILFDEARTNLPVTVARFLEAAVFVLCAFAFLLFFPACIIMFVRVERRLNTILEELNLRSDHGSALLPFEFSPREAEGSGHHQVEMPIVDVRRFLRDIKSSAASQRRQFVFCLFFVLIALVGLAIHAVFVAASAFRASTPRCSLCDSRCQSIQYVIALWYLRTPEIAPLVASLGMPLPLCFALWLMTTPEDRALLMHPGRFLSDAVALQPAETELDARLRAERVRMGIDLRSGPVD